ncbi:hypothetical protein BH09SUM1_BH09SUM1_25630 [soil metagenome]
MSFKPAKDFFTQAEITEILRRNVFIYKDEPDFDRYLVELTMYLLDRHYGPDRISLSEPPLPPRSSGAVDLRKFLDMDLPKPHQPDAEPVATGPLPRLAPRGIDRPATQTPFNSGDAQPRPFQMHTSPAPTPPSPPPRRAQHPQAMPPPQPQQRTPPIRSQGSPLATPMPPDSQGYGGARTGEGLQPPPRPNAEPQEPAKDGENPLGRARIYRVVRPYKSTSAVELPCSVCGSRVPFDSKQCPGCGRLM